MGKKMRIAASLVLAVCAVFLGMRAYFTESSSQSQNIVGAYEDRTYGEDLIIRIIFHETMTYVMEVDGSGEILTVDSGSYALIDGGVQTFSETDDVFSVYYSVDGDNIFSDEFDTDIGGDRISGLSFKKVK